jgi:hypothetical protein
MRRDSVSPARWRAACYRFTKGDHVPVLLKSFAAAPIVVSPAAIGKSAGTIPPPQKAFTPKNKREEINPAKVVIQFFIIKKSSFFKIKLSNKYEFSKLSFFMPVQYLRQLNWFN